MIKRIRKWWKYSKPRDLYYNVTNGISNLVYFFPMIWKYRTWGNSHIYLMWEYSLRRHRENITKYGYSEGDKESIDSLRKAELVLRRLSDDDNYWYSQDQHTKEDNWMAWKWNHPLNKIEDMNKLIVYARRRRKQDIDYLAKLIYKHGESWSH